LTSATMLSRHSQLELNLWLVKNSFQQNSQKRNCARKPHNRFARLRSTPTPDCIHHAVKTCNRLISTVKRNWMPSPNWIGQPTSLAQLPCLTGSFILRVMAQDNRGPKFWLSIASLVISIAAATFSGLQWRNGRRAVESTERSARPYLEVSAHYQAVNEGKEAYPLVVYEVRAFGQTPALRVKMSSGCTGSVTH